MTLGIRELLDLPVWRAFDIDETGRILAGSDASGTIQLVELAPDGTATPLTALPGACQGRYLPGRRAVLVEHDEGGNELAQLSILGLDPLPTAPVGLDGLEPLVRDSRYFHRLIEVTSASIVYTTNRRNGADHEVIVRDAVTGVETVVYDGSSRIDDAAVAPDGRRAVIVRDSELPASMQLLLSEQAAAEGEAAGGGAQAGAAGTGAIAGAGAALRELTGSDEHSMYLRPHWIDSALIVTTNRDREFTLIARLDPDSGTWINLVTDDERDLTAWPSPDGQRLLVMANDDGVTRLSLHDAATGDELRKLSLPSDGWTGDHPTPEPVWSKDSRYIAISFTAPAVPGDILRIDSQSGEVTTLADSTAALGGAWLAQPVSHRVPAHDGEMIPCYVYGNSHEGSEPVESGLAGSVVILIHGGPEGQSVRSFNPFVQALVAAGHTVLVPNVRGSVGYGKRWYSADDGRLRLDSVADLASLHSWLPSQGLDQRRAALWGGSYGGYMVLAGLAFQPDLWAAGVDIVGISSLLTFLENTSTYRRAAREREYGWLDRDRDFLIKASPLSRVEDMRAPLFVIHGANDPRVPLSEAEQLVAAVRANGAECELLVYGDEGHGLAKRANRLDAYPKAVAFIARHLTGKEER
jgi:dipeptidyl aminopeptidase/acylaminoacyl peptidase